MECRGPATEEGGA